MNLPESFKTRMQELLGDDFQAYTDSFSQEGYGQTLRVNPLKTKPADLIRRFLCKEENELAKVPWCPEGYYYRGPERLSRHPLYYGGAYYLQEPSAMAPATFLPVRPGDRVLDLCAAPGGKSVALAGKLGGQGILVSNDISASRSKALLKNLELFGAGNILVTCEAPAKLAEVWPGFFDAILVDAPCSGEGMFRKEKGMQSDWSPDQVKKYAALQKEILDRAFAMLAPGGCLLYSTCTYAPEEDEENVLYFLDKMDDLDLLPLPIRPGVEEGRPEWVTGFLGDHPDKEILKNCRRFLPHKVEGEGQFAALFHKAGNREDQKDPAWKPETICTLTARDSRGTPKGRKTGRGRQAESGRRGRRGPEPGKPEGQTLLAALEDYTGSIRNAELAGWQSRIYVLEERVFLLPPVCPDFRRVRTLRSGLYLGDFKKGRFQPSQALAMALDPAAYPNTVVLTMEDERVERYLKGETIEVDGKDGWALICVEDYPLGWGKLSRGRLKNKYQPGWRMQ